MSESEKTKLVTFKSAVLNILLTGIVFLFFTYILQDYVPLHEGQQDSSWRIGLSALTASCLAGVFWLAFSMFSVVYIDCKTNKR